MADASLQAEQEQDAVVERKPIVLKNGTLKDPVTGHFLPGSKPTTAIMSSAQGKALSVRRQEAGQRYAREALARKAEENGLARSPAAAVGLAAGTLFEAALTVAPEGKVREAREGFMGAIRLAGMLSADERAPAVAPPDGLAVTGEGIAFLRQLVERAAGQVVESVVEGEVRDVGPGGGD
jgi:hypothetical protein